MKQLRQHATLRSAAPAGFILMVSALGLLACCTTGDGTSHASDNPSRMLQDGKIDASLAMVLRDPALMERLQKDPSSARSTVSFVIEAGSGGRLLVPLFVESTDVARTSEAIRESGGSVETTIGMRLVARMPLDQIVKLAARGDVARIEASSRENLKH